MLPDWPQSLDEQEHLVPQILDVVFLAFVWENPQMWCRLNWRELGRWEEVRSWVSWPALALAVILKFYSRWSGFGCALNKIIFNILTSFTKSKPEIWLIIRSQKPWHLRSYDKLYSKEYLIDLRDPDWSERSWLIWEIREIWEIRQI